MSKVVVIGIDQSLSSTGVCIHSMQSRKSGSVSHKYIYYNIVASTKWTKKMDNFEHPDIYLKRYNKIEGTDYESKEVAKTKNIYSICMHLESLISMYKAKAIVLEGISYGSTGSASLVDLSGLNYCIRIMALRTGVDVRIASPMTVKKKATGNGGATKDEMVWAWQHCDNYIKDASGIKMDDMADAYFLSRVYEDDYLKQIREL